MSNFGIFYNARSPNMAPPVLLGLNKGIAAALFICLYMLEVSSVTAAQTILQLTRGRGGLTHHLHSEAPAGNRRMAMTFAK